MNYFIDRNGQPYGPYTIADLQRYVASGQILLTDLAHIEGSTVTVPVSQLIGGVPAPPGQMNRNPPNLHWGLVLLFGFFTCGLFDAVWSLVQAEWMKKVAPQSQALGYYIAAICSLVAIAFVSFQTAARHGPPNTTVGLLNLVYFILLLIGRFSLKASLEQYYNMVEPIGLSLSGVMVFFFGDIYFQYKFNEINRRRMFGGVNQLPA
jgi:hypothetical protein